MQSAIWRRVSIGVLLLPHRITIFFTENGKGKLTVRNRTFSTQSPPMPKFNAFIGTKYPFHAFGYLLRPATMESSSRRVLGFESLIIN